MEYCFLLKVELSHEDSNARAQSLRSNIRDRNNFRNYGSNEAIFELDSQLSHAFWMGNIWNLELAVISL